MALWNRILFPISNIWDHGDGDKSPYADTTSFSAQTGGKGPGPGELAPEGFDNSQDSLTQSTRAITNYTGQAGKESYERGRSITDKGIDHLLPSINYFGKLLSGDPAAIAEAMQPETDQITQQFSQIRKMFSQTGARGGGTASTLAQSPYEQVRMLTDLTAKTRANAADNLGRFGLQEAQIGQQEESLGINSLHATNQGLLARRGQNYQVDTANRQMLTGGMSNVLTALL